MEDDIQIVNTISPQDYTTLRNSAGWKPMSERQTVSELIGSARIFCAKENGKVIGVARVVGNGYYMWISDVIVLPEFQGKQIGKRLVDCVIRYTKESLYPGEECMLYLMSVEGKENFYERMGFTRRPHGTWGAGMCMKLEGQQK